jgi:hypothetical protein
MKRRIKAFGEHYHNFMQTLGEKEKLKNEIRSVIARNW